MNAQPIWRRIIAALVAIAAVAVAVAGVLAPDDHRAGGNVTINVNGRTFDEVDPPGPIDVLADTNTTRQPDEAAPGLTGLEAHEDLRDETPPGVTPAEDRHADRVAKRIGLRLDPRPLGGAQAYSCRTHPVVNQSPLSAPRVGVALHVTVSDPGSLDGIYRVFNTPSFGASSNYGFELYNGRCEQWVSPLRKAWAQGAFNSAYTSIEIISRLRPTGSWLKTPALRNGTLAALVRDELARAGAPIRLVNPSGCTPLAGLTDHDRLECGNDHVDVGNDQGNPSSATRFPWAFFLRQVKLGVKRPISRRDRAACRRVASYRDRRRAHHHPASRVGQHRQARRLKRLKARRLKCVKGHVRRR